MALPLLLAVLFALAGAAASDQSAQGDAPDLRSWTVAEKHALAGAPAPSDVPASVSSALRSYSKTLLSPDSGSHVMQVGFGEEHYYLLRAEFDSAASRRNMNVPGATVLTAYDRFVDLFIPPKGNGFDTAVVRAVILSPGFRFLDWPQPVTLPPPNVFSATRPTRAVPEEIVRGGIAGLTGRGVIVAVVDSGLDFRNPDFITNDATGKPTSRLLYLWDSFSTAFESKKLGSKPPYSYPDGRPIGTLYTHDQLTAELRESAHTIPATDEHGHGTAAAGVAAGNGNNSDHTNRQLIGVAPEADLIGVRLGGAEGAMENGYLLSAVVAWLDDVARREGKPLVVSCSFGGQHGGHDGGSVEERELDARFAADVRGRAIVIAAGNEQQDGLHAQLFTKGPGDTVRFAWQAKRPTIVSFYMRLQDAGAGTMRDLSSDIAFGSLGITTNGVKSPDPLLLRAYFNPLTGDTVAEFVVQEGWQGLEFANKSGAATQFDGYANQFAAFHPQLRRVGELVGTPGTTSGAITVGSYDWNDLFSHNGQMYTLKDPCGNAPMKIGALSCYSSVGFSRAAGVVKPDITAPGEWYTASYAHLPDGSGVRPSETIVESSGKYRAFNGTSAATPYTSGIIALMLQKRPTLTSGEIKNLMRRNATSDEKTGPVPNPAWGYGKLNLAAVEAILRSL